MENFFLEARENFFLLSHVALAYYNGSFYAPNTFLEEIDWFCALFWLDNVPHRKNSNLHDEPGGHTPG